MTPLYTMNPQRTEPRLPKDAPIRVFGMDSQGRPVNLPAQTVDVSQHGARVAGVRSWTHPGEIIGVRYGTEKARYRIVWVGSEGTQFTGQIGLQCVETGKYIWDAPATASASVPKPTPAVPSRKLGPQFSISAPTPVSFDDPHRREARFSISGGANIREAGKNIPQWARLQDLSAGGCYVETTAPLAPFSRVEITLHVGETKIEAQGTVTVKHPLVGMGIQFTELSPMNRERLHQVISQIEHAKAAASGLGY
jgi:hypothetical protein